MMLFRSCCRSDTSVVDLVVPFLHQTLGAKTGNIVIATVDPSSEGDHGRSLGLVLTNKILSSRQTNGKQENCPAIVIERILSGSSFEETFLQPGMIIFRINDIDIGKQTITEVERYLLNANRPLRVWALVPCSSSNSSNKTSLASVDVASEDEGPSGRSIVAVVDKGQDASIGISLLRNEETGRFTVGRIDPSSPLYRQESSLLRQGMIITTINGVMITGMDMEVVRSMMYDSPYSVILTAEIPLNMEEPPMLRRRVAATIHKSNPDQPLGLSFLRIPNGSEYHHHTKRQSFTTLVGRIAPQSPFRMTELQVGMTVVSVNGLDIASSNVRSLLHYLQECPAGKVVLVAEMDVPPGDFARPRSSWTSSSIENIMEPATRQNALVQPDYSDRSHSVASSSHALPSQALWNDAEGPWPTSMTSPSRIASPTRLSLTFEGVATGSTASSTTSRATYHSKAFTVEAVKESNNDRIGLALNEDSGSFFVTGMAPDSMFRDTELHVGCEILNINGIQLFGMDMAFVSMILHNVIGRIQLGVFPAVG